MKETYWFWVTGSKVKFGTLSITHCGHDKGYSFCLISFKLHVQVVDDEREEIYWFWGHGVKGQGQFFLFIYKNLWTWYRLQFKTNHFQISTNTFQVMWGGTLLILVHKGKVLLLQGMPRFSWTCLNLCVNYIADLIFCIIYSMMQTCVPPSRPRSRPYVAPPCGWHRSFWNQER